MEYADDVDFIDEEKDTLDRLLPIAGQILKDSNLFMNEAKTEFTHVYLSDTQEKGENDELLRGKEEWRNSKILGSLLCSTSDITSRCVMGNIAFQSFWKIWIRGSKILRDEHHAGVVKSRITAASRSSSPYEQIGGVGCATPAKR